MYACRHSPGKVLSYLGTVRYNMMEIVIIIFNNEFEFRSPEKDLIKLAEVTVGVDLS
jgi:hypothetical protein